MIYCEKTSSGGTENLPVVDKFLECKCLNVLKRVATVAISLFSFFASGCLMALAAVALFSVTTSVLPYLFILTTALSGLICAAMVLWDSLSGIRCKEQVSSKLEEISKDFVGKKKKEEDLVLAQSTQEGIDSSTKAVGGYLCSIGDDVAGAFDDINKVGRRPRSNSQ
ncbi:hypothetical protein [Chlamydia sp.]|uniref:hypothetical protein n=1 Tax=Chlamydia sp. TaxID=35827 RepID=UPI0025BC065B|nr:hypothetical protein [Chlamydia sp.]MBQ8498742.1 hypothetical protein [Chlamydia sp.]